MPPSPTSRDITARKTTRRGPDDEIDLEFWARVTPNERFAEAWRLSEEIWRLKGWDPGGARFLGGGAYAVSFHTESDLSTPDVVFQIGVAPRRIDVMTSITGMDFGDAWPTRTEAAYGGVGFPVIGIDALMKNKQALGRPKDLLDLDLLRRHHPR